MPEATAGLSSGSWGASAGLPGRFSDNGSYKGAMSGTSPANCRFIREARLSDKSREISVRTHSEAGIPRVSNRHCGNEVFLARNENTQNSESGREISLRANFGKTTSQFSGPVAGYPSSHNSCAIVISKSDCVLITPVWKSRPWYPVILSLLADRPLLLPKDSKLLQLPGTDKVHPLCSQKNFRLAAWPLSGKKYQNRGFLRRYQRYCRPHGDKKLPVSTKVPGRHGVVGVIRDKLIIFQHL